MQFLNEEDSFYLSYANNDNATFWLLKWFRKRNARIIYFF